MLERMTADPVAVRRYAGIADKLGWPCYGTAWPDWAEDVAGPYPITLRLPRDSKLPAIERNWRRLADGSIEATYDTQEELAWCLAVSGVDSPDICGVLPSATAGGEEEHKTVPGRKGGPDIEPRGRRQPSEAGSPGEAKVLGQGAIELVPP